MPNNSCWITRKWKITILLERCFVTIFSYILCLENYGVFLIIHLIFRELSYLEDLFKFYKTIIKHFESSLCNVSTFYIQRPYSRLNMKLNKKDDTNFTLYFLRFFHYELFKIKILTCNSKVLLNLNWPFNRELQCK